MNDFRKVREDCRNDMTKFATNIHKQIGLIGDYEREARLNRLKGDEKEPKPKSAPKTPTKPNVCMPPLSPGCPVFYNITPLYNIHESIT